MKTKTVKYYVSSNRFHSFRVLSAHRSFATATAAFERDDARHAKECTCGGPFIINTTATLRVGYSLSDSQGRYVPPVSSAQVHARAEVSA